MFSINFKIQIGNVLLKSFSTLEIQRSVENLSATCTVELPAIIANLPIGIEAKIKRGDKVSIDVGYGEKRQEFSGYLRSISPNTPMKLEFEDDMYLFRKKAKDKVYTKVDINTIVADIVQQVGGFTVKSTLSGIMFDKFVVRDLTCYQVLEKLKQETSINIFVIGTELNTHLLFTARLGEAQYYTHHNIKKGTNLQYVVADDANYQVKAIGKTTKSATVELTVGKPLGELKILKFPNISDRDILEKLANEQLKKFGFTGYRGDIKAWGEPFCSIGYTAHVTDELYPEREGSYYVTAVKTTVSLSEGFGRIVSLGLKLS